MYLAPDGDEIEVAGAAAALLAEVMPIDRLHRSDAANMSPACRKALGEMGWFALAVPEGAGGSGLSAVEHALFFREVGRQCGPVDVLSQSLASNTIRDAGLHHEVIRGARGVSLMVGGQQSYRILGDPAADFSLFVTTDEASLYSVSEIDLLERPSLDPANSMHVTRYLPAPIARCEGWRIWQLGQLGTAAMLVGIAEASLDLIVEYAKLRETFGRKIGAWQAVRHPCAEMAVRAEAARAQHWYSAAAIKGERSDADVHLDAAKHIANQAALANCDANIQLHGGIGVMQEHNAHLLLKHALVLSRLFGSKRSLLARLLHARVEV